MYVCCMLYLSLSKCIIYMYVGYIHVGCRCVDYLESGIPGMAQICYGVSVSVSHDCQHRRD
jgi:hypothetical protein